jgi:ADP-ribose pyrophosphatase
MGGSRERQLIHRGKKFDFEMVSFTNDAGKRVDREVVRHPGAVVILPLVRVEGVDSIVMIRNARFTLEQTLWELPAGTREAGEEPAVTAGRELTEETGWVAGRIEPLVWFYTTPGMTDEKMFAFVARDLTESRTRLEEDERIEPRVVPVDEVMGMVDRGEIVDGKSLVTLLTAVRVGIIASGMPAERR